MKKLKLFFHRSLEKLGLDKETRKVSSMSVEELEDLWDKADPADSIERIYCRSNHGRPINVSPGEQPTHICFALEDLDKLTDMIDTSLKQVRWNVDVDTRAIILRCLRG
jgi:hypothetical protein